MAPAWSLRPWPTAAVVAGFVHQAWQAQQWHQACARRKDFRGAPVPDFAAVAAEVGRARPEDQAAALRSLLVGSAIPQAVAVHWTGTASVPLLRCPTETLVHRLWTCPRWAALRAQAASRPITALPAAMAQHFILPRDAEAEAARCAAEATELTPITARPAGTHDGSALDPRDRLLRRAAWAATWFAHGTWHAVVGGVLGRQTAARAELTALEWVARAAAAGAPVREVVTDCQYVADGAVTLARDPGASLAVGPDGDLWASIARSPPRARWIPAHLEWPQAAARGLSRADWFGNRLADQLAGREAERRRAPSPLRRRRRAGLRLLAAPTMSPAASRWPPWRRAAAWALTAMASAARRIWQRRLAAEPLLAARARPPDPAGPIAADATLPRRGLPWVAECRRCGARAPHTSRWRALLRTPCGGGQWEWGHQDLDPAAGGWRCRRCWLFARPGHRAEATRGRCPVPATAPPEAQAAYRVVLARVADWRHWYRGGELAPAPPAGLPRRPAAALPPPTTS